MLSNALFNCKNKECYPPFKEGLYLEEFCVNRYLSWDASQRARPDEPKLKRKHIPVKWTNFQRAGWFQHYKALMQHILDKWVLDNPSEHGYFTIVQYDDGPLLKLPDNTVIYGACSGDVPIPLIYEDVRHKLENIPNLDFDQKTILCSFVGTLTHSVRNEMYAKLQPNTDFLFSIKQGWSPVVDKHSQDIFVVTTLNSKFALAPRGYGRSSFRLFEILQLGSIPIYIWDDKEWLPYKDVLDLSKFMISINIKDIDTLHSILSSIDKEKYNQMLHEYNKVKHYFELEGMFDHIMSQNTLV